MCSVKRKNILQQCIWNRLSFLFVKSTGMYTHTQNVVVLIGGNHGHFNKSRQNVLLMYQKLSKSMYNILVRVVFVARRCKLCIHLTSQYRGILEQVCNMSQ